MVKKTKQNNIRTRRISPNLTAIIGALVIMIGGFFLSYDYINSMRVSTFDSYGSTLYKEEDGVAVIEPVEPEEQKEETGSKEDVTETVTEAYLGYLTIPKINLKKGFFPIDSAQNNVDRNLFIVNGSSYPDIERGNFIIASHSGLGWNAFFRQLYKVEKGDQAIVTYGGKNYTYTITKIYTQTKTGTIAIYRNYEKTTLTLVTCTKDDLSRQTVYIAELTDVQDA
ncbi:MAG: sortase [Bacilli bacterium]|nr:sortase [Bacilli bacterium]